MNIYKQGRILRIKLQKLGITVNCIITLENILKSASKLKPGKHDEINYD